ncbi:MAG TPA: DNA repair protein RecO [Candidatus Saccharimonadales bacterium]|nr:DNA repair protein RecO [Candidatus Saccharimonadales bacterium]
MKQFKTTAIVLRRVNYGEADRIISFITSDHGKVSAIAKGVRRSGSKLGGGLEPFSESTITFGAGRGELAIVLSTRLEKFYKNIMTDYDRLQLGYEALKLVDRSTEDVVDRSFYELLRRTFIYLDELSIATGFTELWFRMQLEDLLGRSPDLTTDIEGNKLQEDATYTYDVHERGLAKSGFGNLTAAHIKLLRLARDHSPAVLAQVQGAEQLLPGCLEFVRIL